MGSSEKDKVFSGVFWKFGESILAQALLFIVSLVLARILSPDDYGVVPIVMVFITFANIFVSSGFAKSLVQKKDADDTDYSSIFYCTFFISIVLYLILFFSAPAISRFFEMPMLSPVLRVFSLRIIIGSYNSVQHAYVSRNMLFKKFFFSTLIGTIISGVAGIIAAYMGLGIWAIVIQNLGNALIDTLVLNFTISWRPKLLFSFNAAKKLMSFGWKVLVTDFLANFFDQLRYIVIGKMYTSADVAFYDRGRVFSSLISDNAGQAFISVLFPALSNKSDDIGQVKNLVRRGIRVIYYVILPATVGIALVARPLVIVLITEKWLDSVPFIQILCASAVVALMGNLSNQAIESIGRSDVSLKLEFIKKPVYVILLIIGVNINIIWVAVTMLIYSLYSTITNCVAMKKLFKYTYREQLADLSPSFFATVGMGIPVYLLNFLDISSLPMLILQVLTGGILYIVISIVFKIDSYEYLKNYIKDKMSKQPQT